MRIRSRFGSMVAAVAFTTLMGAVVPASATTLSFTVNWGPNGPINPPSGPLVGLAVKVDSGSASVQSISGAISGAMYGLPPGWSQQPLASSFVAGTNPTASSSQYGFVRGGGGSTYDTADSYGGTGTASPLGFTASFLLDASYTPTTGDAIVILWTTFTDAGILSGQAKHTFTYDGTNWSGAGTNGSFWSQADSGSFNQLSAAVVPGSGVMALGSLGLAGLSRRRRR